MTNENELLARWLGWTSNGQDWKPPGSGIHEFALPRFRASNEWAGALIERLNGSLAKLVGNQWEFIGLADDIYVTADTWRDAVVDAALEIIGRNSA